MISLSHLASAGSLLVLLATGGPVVPQEPSPTATPVAPEAAPAPPAKPALPPDLVANFPIGRVFKGVILPSYEGDQLKSVLNADTVVRVDDQFLDLANLVIHVYNAAGEPETSIEMDEAAFDLYASELKSKTPATIEQPRFTMTGDTMYFQIDTQLARLVGNVKVVIPDARSLTPDFGFPGAASKPDKTP
ncbi:MAG TPA: LPS export ABC transporter periplasmic protein LptC [Bacteroidia bacterium]|nr:LPS export ABC transporter periplasmic protein LptC [Bacteroidia bacterium]